MYIYLLFMREVRGQVYDREVQFFDLRDFFNGLLAIPSDIFLVHDQRGQISLLNSVLFCFFCELVSDIAKNFAKKFFSGQLLLYFMAIGIFSVTLEKRQMSLVWRVKTERNF